MIKRKKRIFLPFAFLKISTCPLAAHLQVPQADTQTKTCKRAAILPTLKK